MCAFQSPNTTPSSTASPLYTSLWADAGASSTNSAATSRFLRGRTSSDSMNLSPAFGGGEEARDQAVPEQPNSSSEAADASLVRKLVQTKMLALDPSRLRVNEQMNRLIHAKSTWNELHVPNNIIRALLLAGFDTPSMIQSAALDILFKNKNLIAQSQSGTGKTIAFVIRLLQLIDPNAHHAQAIVLEPTFELALQTASVIRKLLGEEPRFAVCEAVRGSRVERGSMIKEQIIVGTPGTVLDWVTKARVLDAKKIRIYVLDEADVMIAQQGHQDQSVRIYKMMDENSVQTALFSATYEPKVLAFAKKIIRDPDVITVKTEDLSLDAICQYYVIAGNDEEKIRALRSFYGVITVDNAIVFCRTREIARKIHAIMSQDGHTIGRLEGEMDVAARAESIMAFREGKVRLLIATNVAARGIDVQSVNLVVNFDLPLTPEHKPDFETYIHRIGRTGRFGRGGLAISFVKDDRDLTVLKAFQNYFKREIKPLDHTDTDQLESLNAQT
ncbi:ATP-dependent RNA helicase DDX19A [Hypsibius exemplaris]|uniref:RNA helicase n=1 Tax=Hypsibius exemplaris TaxID=2072580 RepID=A0A9X6RMK3_HYPEX|nr:ATP-dependent RNA helicase DDX19A [Hypsibius exemplaris]